MQERKELRVIIAPTNTEIEAAAEAIWTLDPSIDILGQSVPWAGDRYFDTKQIVREMARAALIAARKVQP